MSLSDADAIRRLLDIEEIKQLKARYCRFVDTGDLESMRGVFTDDAQFDLGGVGVYDSADAFMEGMYERRRNAVVRTVHHCHTPEITITGPDSAEGIWAMCDLVERQEADGTRRAFTGFGHYEEQYRRENGEWRICRLRIVRLRIIDLPADRMPALAG